MPAMLVVSKMRNEIRERKIAITRLPITILFVFPVIIGMKIRVIINMNTAVVSIATRSGNAFPDAPNTKKLKYGYK